MPDGPRGETLVALSRARCIGLIDTFLRFYRVGGQQVLVREPGDWVCLACNQGVGMRLMKWLISRKEPLLGVDLPKAAIAIAPRLNWKHLLDTHDFVLPITARRVAAAVLRKASLGDGSVTKYLPRSVRPRTKSTWRQYRELDGSGFRADRELVGSTICRIEASKVGRKARLIDVQSCEPDVKRLQWMIAENTSAATAREAASFRFQIILAAHQCRAWFSRLPSRGERGRDGGLQAAGDPHGPGEHSFLRGDDAMIPFLIAE